MLVTEFGISICFRLEQLKKVRFSILVMVLGNCTDVKFEQSAKALSPMVVMEFGNSMDVKLEQ